MMSEFLGSFLTPSLSLVRILFADPLLVKSEFHGPPPSPELRISFMDVLKVDTTCIPRLFIITLYRGFKQITNDGAILLNVVSISLDYLSYSSSQTSTRPGRDSFRGDSSKAIMHSRARR